MHEACSVKRGSMHIRDLWHQARYCLIMDPLKSKQPTDLCGRIDLRQAEDKPFSNKPWYSHVCSTSHLKTLWEKEKLLITSNFSFSHNVSSSLWKLSAIFIKFEIIRYKLFQLEDSYGKELKDNVNCDEICTQRKKNTVIKGRKCCKSAFPPFPTMFFKCHLLKHH